MLHPLTHSAQAQTDSIVATKRLSSSQTLLFVHGPRSLIFGRVCPRIPLNLAAVEILAKDMLFLVYNAFFFASLSHLSHLTLAVKKAAGEKSTRTRELQGEICR